MGCDIELSALGDSTLSRVPRSDTGPMSELGWARSRVGLVLIVTSRPVSGVPTEVKTGGWN